LKWSGIVQAIGDSKRSQRFVTHPADELPAHSMPRVGGCLVQSHRHSSGLQSNAQRQTGQSAARNGDWFFQRREATSLNATRQWDDLLIFQ